MIYMGVSALLPFIAMISAQKYLSLAMKLWASQPVVISGLIHKILEDQGRKRAPGGNSS